jgi:HSP20 family molecular chaperone IbpA
MPQARHIPTSAQQTRGQSALTPLVISRQQGQGGLLQREESIPSIWTESPFSIVRQFSEDMDEFFGGAFGEFGMAPSASLRQTGWSPPMELVQRDDELVVCLDLPGMSADDLNVEVIDHMLTIAGERRDEREQTGAGYRSSERRYGRFSRSVELPEGISADDLRATFRNGVLEVAMPAPQQEGPGRRIEIQGGAHAPDEERAALIEEFKEALKRTDEIQLSVTGRVSGRKISHPVWFVQGDNTLYLLPVKGSDSEWFKNALKNPTITLTARRVSLPAQAVPITDPAKVEEVVEKFRAKYGAEDVSKYYSKFDVAVAVPLE